LILKSVIHDWNDERSLTILKHCYRALPVEGRVLLVERLRPEVPEVDPDHCSTLLSDLNMLRGPGGGERTESEYRTLLAASGFTVTRVLPADRFNIIEAVAT
jgi:hypothetical protein